ncbi:MAG: hypothetical protein IT291_02160 [Deltaproteobacteria bacterium]|nr:hypothetical protein [Deltaproteobacteria bacterium]
MTDVSSHIVNISVDIDATNDNGGVFWKSYIRDGKFSEALSLIDRSLVDDPHCIETRLWWVYCQLGVGGLPLSALSAPLEEIMPQLEGEKKLARLSASVFSKLGAGLVKREQWRLAVVMLGRASRFLEADDGASSSERVALARLFSKAISCELERAEDRRGNKSYIDELKKKLSDVNERLSRLEKLCANGHLESPAKELEMASPITSTSPELFPNAERTKPHLVAYLVIFVLLLALVGGGVAVTQYRQAKKVAAFNAAIAVAASKLARAEVAMPLVARHGEVMDDNSELESVRDRLNNLAERLKVDVSETSLKDGQSVEPLATAQAVDKELMRPEPTDAEKGDSPTGALKSPKETSGRDSARLEDVPELSLEELRTTKSEDLGMVNNGESSSRYVRGPDGRLYGPALEGGERTSAGGASELPKTLDGSELKAYNVERFEPPLVYRTIVETRVIEAPSSLGAVIAELRRDAKVQVIARMGHWLEVRSVQGKRGYIYAQDAVRE